MLIDYSQVIVSSLRDHTIDEIVGTSANLPPYMSKLALSLVGTSYRYEYGTLLAFRAEKENGLQIIHVQGENAQTNDPTGRRSDTRIVYNIEPSELRKVEYKLGSILTSLPELEPFYASKLIGQLPTSLDIQAPKSTNNVVESLRKHMISAIIERKKLLVQLDVEDILWQGNDLFSNAISQIIFSTLDSLPYEFRQIASLGLSFDDKHRPHLNNCQFLFYQGTLSTDSFGLKDTSHISWSELQSCTPILSESEIRYYRMYCRILAKQYGTDAETDLFSSEMSSREMFLGIHEIRRSIEEFENLLRFSVEKKAANIQRLFCEELLSDMTTYPLGLINSIVYSILKDSLYTDSYKKELLRKYNREYKNVDHMFGQSVDELVMKDITQIEASNNYSLEGMKSDYPYLHSDEIYERFMQYLAEQNKFMIIHKATAKLGETENLTSEMKDFFFFKIIEQLQSKAATIQMGQFVSIARSVSSEEQKKMLANYLSNRDDLRIFEELFTSNELSSIQEIVQQGFNQWKGWHEDERKLDRAICRPPFLEHLTAEQLLQVRRVRLSEWSSYRELYATIEYADIVQIYELSTNRLQAINSLVNLMTEEQKQLFVNENIETLLETFEVMLHQMEDVTKTTIWQLLSLRSELRFQITFKSDSLSRIITNIQRLRMEKVQLDYSVASLYECCSSLDEVQEVYSLIQEKGKTLQLEPDLDSFKSIHHRFSERVEEYFRALIWFFRKGVTIPHDLSSLLIDMVNKSKTYDELSAGFEFVLMQNIPYSQVEFTSVLRQIEKRASDEEARNRFELFLTSNHLIKWKKLFDKVCYGKKEEPTQSGRAYMPELFSSLFAEPTVEPTQPAETPIVSIEESVREESIVIEQTIDDNTAIVAHIEPISTEIEEQVTFPQEQSSTPFQKLFYLSLIANVLLLLLLVWSILKG